MAVGALTHSAPAVDISFLRSSRFDAAIHVLRTFHLRISSSASDPRARARFGRLGAPVLFFLTTESTNDVASALAASGGRGSDAGAVVVADTQTAGRGRRGRLVFSARRRPVRVGRPLLDPGRARSRAGSRAALLTLAAGVALADAVYRTTRPRARYQVAQRSP